MEEELVRKRGQGLVEYALVLVLVAIVVIVVLALLGPAIGNLFSNVQWYLSAESAEAEGGSEPAEGGAQRDCYGSLLLPYFVGVVALFLGISCLMPASRAAVKA